MQSKCVVQTTSGLVPVCALAHRLLNQLTIITGYAELLAEEAKDSPITAKRVGLIQRAAQEMTTDLLSEAIGKQDCFRQSPRLEIEEAP